MCLPTADDGFPNISRDLRGLIADGEALLDFPLRPDDRPPEAAIAEFKGDDAESEVNRVHHFIGGIAA